MLVLSRREAEKVLFPGLGISVEVTKIQGKTVRLGIQAPPEIPILRDELDDNTPEFHAPGLNGNNATGCQETTNGGFQHSPTAHREIQKHLDAANLAIHLAQNQLRQRLCDHSEEALGHALDSLEKLELVVMHGSPETSSELTVRETGSGYHLDSQPEAIVVPATDKPTDQQLQSRLTEQGFRAVTVADTPRLIRHLQSSAQPAAVFTVDPVSPQKRFADDEKLSQPGLRIAGINGLQNGQCFRLGQNWIHGWFADAEHGISLVRCLQNQDPAAVCTD